MPIDPNAMALAWFFRHDELARDAVVTVLDQKIKRMAKNYGRRCKGNVETEDLYQAGRIGLVKSLDKFTPDAGDYEPYAMNVIRGEMLHLIRDHSLTIKVPGSVKETGWKISKFRSAFKLQHKREPSQEEIAESLNLSITRVEHCISITRRPKDTCDIEDHAGEPSSVEGISFKKSNDLERSALMDIYREAEEIVKSHGNVATLMRHFGITRAKALTLFQFIEKRLE